VRPEKQYAVQEITQKLGQAETFVLTRFAGLTAEKMNEFRSALARQSADYMVVKNRLLKIAAREAGFEQLGEYIDGSVGIILGTDIYSGYLKEVVKFNKQNKLPEILCGYIEQQFLPAENVRTLAELPSKEELRAQLLAGLQAPISSFVGILQQRLSSLVRVLDAICRKKSESGEPEVKETEASTGAEEPAQETAEEKPEAAVEQAEKPVADEKTEAEAAKEKPETVEQAPEAKQQPAKTADKEPAAEAKPEPDESSGGKPDKPEESSIEEKSEQGKEQI